MKSQPLFALASLAIGLALFVSQVEAQQVRTTTGTRYTTQRPVYTYRTTQPTVRAAAVSRPIAAAPVASTSPATAAPTPVLSAATKPAVVATPVSASPSTPAPAASTAAAAPAQQPRQSFPSAILHMLSRNNSIRGSRGMRPMALSSRLTNAAQSHANYMARTGGFSHYTNGGPQGRAAAHGFRGGVRENIAMGQPSVDSAFNTWTASGAHYANMMSHSDVAGFGYAVGAGGQAYWVAVYANNDGGN